MTSLEPWFTKLHDRETKLVFIYGIVCILFKPYTILLFQVIVVVTLRNATSFCFGFSSLVIVIVFQLLGFQFLANLILLVTLTYNVDIIKILPDFECVQYDFNM